MDFIDFDALGEQIRGLIEKIFAWIWSVIDLNLDKKVDTEPTDTGDGNLDKKD